MPDSHHASHDLELVAAFAAGDATDADLETATSLVAACAECAALHHDLRAIAAALPALPAPVRPRDFRLSPEQAASLRPRGLRALLAAFASPRLSFATPLGSGLAALGIIGILVASGGLPTGGATSTATRLAQPGGQAFASPSLEMLLASPAADALVPAGSVASPAAGAPAASEAPANAGGGDTQGEGVPSAAPMPAPYANEPAATGTAPAGIVPADEGEAKAADGTMLIVATTALLVGLALVALRWTSRRFA